MAALARLVDKPEYPPLRLVKSPDSETVMRPTGVEVENLVPGADFVTPDGKVVQVPDWMRD